jgi:endonuclease/exonuclease/phosphatase (EEP) superfamily protein YafD
MRVFVTLFFSLLAVFHAAAAPLTVVTWNCRWFPGGFPDADAAAQEKQMAEAQAVVKELNPDVLLLQEVRDWAAVERLCSVVPGLKVDVASSFLARPQNVVVASKLPADSAWFAVWQPKLGPDDPPRGYAFAALKLPSGRVLLTYSVHMKSNLGDLGKNIRTREESARQLVEHSKAMVALYGSRFKGTAVLVGGDFNSSLDTPKFNGDGSVRALKTAGLQWVFANVPPADRVTIPASGKFPDDCFDHIFYSGLKLDGVSVFDGRGISDHNPVVARFQD